MAWCPFAIHKPLSENHAQGGITPRAVILHTAVSSSPSLFDFFQNRSDLESHFYVRDDGTIEQYMDTQIRADANLNANGFAVSIETQDGGQIVPWTTAQVDAIVKLVDWLCTTHGIPRVQIPSAYGSGIGWHVQFGAPGPWTPVAKSCPGGPRIEQTRNVIIPRVAARQIEEIDLLPDERTWLKGNADALGDYYEETGGETIGKGVADLKKLFWKGGSVTGSVDPNSLLGKVKEIDLNVAELHGELFRLDSKLTDVANAVAALEVGGVDVEQLAGLLKTELVPAVADEIDRRNRDGNPGTGQVS